MARTFVASERSRSRQFNSLIDALEARQMLCSDSTVYSSLPSNLGIYPADIVLTKQPAAATSTSTGTSGAAAASTPLTGVPLLDSDPGASAKIYLDFNGDTTTTWGSYSPGTTPAYDQDGNTSNFSDSEMASIREIWARVSEKFSPFNIDVTTVDPGTYADRSALHVVIGGSGAWLGAAAGGVSYVGSFSNSAPNESFVFPANLANGTAQYVAEAAAHESGHAFGLQHQGTWSGTTLTNEYNPGTTAEAPIMGNSYSATRGVWWYGTPSTSSTAIQDDMAVISSSTNGFGYRPDDAGNTAATAAKLGLSGTTVTGGGVISQTSDADVYSFTTGAGTVNFTASTITKGATLDLKLALTSSSGTVIASADTSSLGESLSATVPSGTYYLTVASHGSYGDVGQYTLGGNVIASTTPTPTPTPSPSPSPSPSPTPTPTAPSAPSGVTATAASSSQINVSWADVSNETGYRIERSGDGSTGWTSVGTVGANVTSFQNTGLAASTKYYYRVFATNAAGSSLASAIFNATTSAPAVTTTIPTAPGNLITSIVSGGVQLQWTDNSTNETGFRVYYSTNNYNWYRLGTVGANVSAATVSGLARGRTYYFRVSAYNNYGESATTGVSSIAAAPPATATGSSSSSSSSTSVTRSLFSSISTNAAPAAASLSHGEWTAASRDALVG